MAPAEAIAHLRAHLCPRASVLSFSSSVAPLCPLGLGILGRGSVRSLIYFYVVTDAGPASHRVRLWQGGPPSTYCRFRLLVLLFTGTSFPGVRLLALPEFRKRPWPLRGSRGDGNGGRFVRSPCLPSLRGLRLSYAVHQMLSLCGPCTATVHRAPGHNRWVSVGDNTPCEDTREDFGLSVKFPATTYCCRVVFLFCVAGALLLDEGVRAVCSKTCSLTPLRKCHVGRGATGLMRDVREPVSAQLCSIGNAEPRVSLARPTTVLDAGSP